MKTRKDREVLLHFSPYPKMFVLGKKDPVLPYESLVAQTEGTAVDVVELSEGHMSLIENKKETLQALRDFVKK